MASSPHKTRAPLTLAAWLLSAAVALGAYSGASLAAGATSAPVTAKAGEDARKQAVQVAMTRLDYQGNTALLKDVIVTQGQTRVQADRAHATNLDDFNNSQWTFEGNVRINGEQEGRLHSDQAVVEFHNNHISKATITGSPAEFEQKRADSNLMARGRAKEITYDLANGTVRLSSDAWLSDGRNEISGPSLVYSIREQRIQATTEEGTRDRVIIKIEPHSDET